MLASAAALVIASTLAGCDRITGLDAPPLEFGFSRTELSEVREDSVTVDVRRRTVVVGGPFSTTSGGGPEPQASLTSVGNSLELTITHTSPGGTQFSMADPFTYVARIGPVDSGSYRVRVRHRMDVVADTSVMVFQPERR